MKKIVGATILAIGVIVIAIGLVFLFKTESINKEIIKRDRIKLEFTEQGEKIVRDDLPLYKEIKTTTYNFRSPEPYDLEISFVSNEDSVEYYSNFLNKMYFNSILKVEAGSFFNDNLSNYMKELYSNPIYLKRSISSGTTKIDNYDVHYFLVINERKENVDIYEENFYIFINGEHNTKLMIKYSVVAHRFGINTLENLLNEVRIKKLDNIYLSTLDKDSIKGELVYDKGNNKSKGKVSYSFKNDNLKEELNSSSSLYSHYFVNKEENNSVSVLLIENQEEKMRVDLETNSIKIEENKDLVEETTDYKDSKLYKFRYKKEVDKETVIISKKINDNLTYMVILKDYKKITNDIIDNFLNINIK